jgi:hypothetical protein
MYIDKSKSMEANNKRTNNRKTPATARVPATARTRAYSILINVLNYCYSDGVAVGSSPSC